MLVGSGSWVNTMTNNMEKGGAWHLVCDNVHLPSPDSSRALQHGSVFVHWLTYVGTLFHLSINLRILLVKRPPKTEPFNTNDTWVCETEIVLWNTKQFAEREPER